MKDDELYPEYLTYLDWKLEESRISNGKYALLKMSRSGLDNFKSKLERDELFNKRIIELHKSVIRDQKIDDIFDDIDF